MNSEQLRLFISGAFGSEAEAREIVKLLRPDLARALVQVRGIVETLPDDSLARQREWREKLPQIEEVMRPYNDAFAVTLSEELPKDGLRAAEETTLQLKSVAPRVAGFVEPAAIMADSTKFLLNTKINEKRVLDMFLPGDDQLSAFMKNNRRIVDLIVTGGIIEGKSTAEIGKLLQDQLPQRLQNQAHALARTAIQDYNRQVKEAVWEANDESFADSGLAYEWVAALDSRTCPTCAPLDGAVRSKNRDFPKTPVHVNCRCQVVLVDPEDPGKVRYGQEAMTEEPTGEGAYKTKKKVKGRNLYRRNVLVETVNGKSPRYADFLANADDVTQQMFFGGGNRAEKFRKLLKTKTPQKALEALTGQAVSDKPGRLFKPVTGEGKLQVSKKKVPRQKKQTRPTKQQAQEQAKATIAEATADLGIDSKELAQALNAANKKVVAKAADKAETLYDLSGKNPVEPFEDAQEVLGMGAFGTVKRVKGGVAKKGFITKAEVDALEGLSDSGATPKLLGKAFIDEKPGKTFSVPTRKGYLFMEEASGKPMSSIKRITEQEALKAFDALIKARGRIHTRGFAHNDMHGGNVLWDGDKMTAIDLGLARRDPRAALIEAIGTRRGVVDKFTQKPLKPGDYQSRQLFNNLNPKGLSAKNSAVWKRFSANRKQVEKLLAAEAPAVLKSSIRLLPREVTKQLSKERALELLKLLYEGIE